MAQIVFTMHDVEVLRTISPLDADLLDLANRLEQFIAQQTPVQTRKLDKTSTVRHR